MGVIMEILVSDPKTKKEKIYKDLISFFTEVKLIQGPKSVEATLFWHKTIRKFLQDYQKERVTEFDKLMESLHIPE